MIKPKGNQPVYIISVAAELIGVHPRTLRIYEEKGLVQPFRTKKKTRLYSPQDLKKIAEICELMDHGLNLAGVKVILEIAEKLHRNVGELISGINF